MDARNPFDRYHADPFFPQSVSDEYLATFIENSVNGFADIVMVPADGESLPGAFFSANLTPYKDSSVGLKLGRIVLVAVGEDRSGWHLRLMTEMTYHFKKCGVQVGYMATQSTNRAVIRNCEKLGYRYGRCTHVFATHA
jgi:dTDP-4-amino-4,6-dideoxy-D-galactose acyltransferase